MTSVDAFLESAGWAGADQRPLAGDASSRRYMRLCLGGKRAILMIDPQDDTARFATMSQHLISVGLSAPDILAHAGGLMILEDFGDDQFATVIRQDPGREVELYRAATDVLCWLENADMPTGLNAPEPRDWADIIEPAFSDYLPAFGIQADGVHRDLTQRLGDALERHLPQEKVLVLRDFHAENMIWLPEWGGVKRVGLLDFQDALMGPPIYDLVSMLQDARRDVSAECFDQTLAYYAETSGRSMDAILPAFHLLGLQRNLRILGIFARLARTSGKTSYLDLIPRVWGHIQVSLQSPASAPLAPLISSVFSDPTPDQLRKIKALCQTP